MDVASVMTELEIPALASSIRRELHMHPELSTEEYHTGQIICR